MQIQIGLSKERIKKHSLYLGEFFAGFDLYRSIDTHPITQFYVLPKLWSDCLRVKPLAHVNLTKKGRFVFKSFHPELIDFQVTEADIQAKINNAEIQIRNFEVTH